MKAIITADWHLRMDTPRCRRDEDWLATQANCIGRIAAEARKRKIPIFITGDLHNTTKVPPYIISMFLKATVGVEVYILAGNHDLPYHNWDNVYRSSFGVLWTMTQRSSNLHRFPEEVAWHHFGQPIENPESEFLFTHELVFPTEKAKPPNVKARTAGELLDAYPDKKYIFTGDYHQAFDFKRGERHVINPGCINIQAADMIDYVPSVVLFDFETGEMEYIEIPDNGEAITDAYLTEEEERNDRIQAFVDQVETTGKVSLDFLDNLDKAMKKNDEELGHGPIEILQELIQEVQA